MTPINQNPDALGQGALQPGDGQYNDWQEPVESDGSEAYPIPDQAAYEYEDYDPSVYGGYDDTYQGVYQAPDGIGAFAAPATCPDGYTVINGVGCIYAGGLSPKVHAALASVVHTIAEGEIAGGRILDASAVIISGMTGPGCDPGNLIDILSDTQALAQTIASLECVLTRKLCCTLTSICECGQNPSGPTCMVISSDMEDALTEIVSSIAKQETAAGDIIGAGSAALDCVNANGSADEIQDALEALGGLAESSADVETALGKKLCLSLGAITSCKAEIPESLREALEDLIESIADSEIGASKLVNTGADTLTETASKGGDFSSIQDAMAMVQELATSALRIEEVTMHKLCLALSALCGDDISDQLNCSLGDCSSICTLDGEEDPAVLEVQRGRA